MELNHKGCNFSFYTTTYIVAYIMLANTTIVPNFVFGKKATYAFAYPLNNQFK